MKESMRKIQFRCDIWLFVGVVLLLRIRNSRIQNAYTNWLVFDEAATAARIVNVLKFCSFVFMILFLYANEHENWEPFELFTKFHEWNISAMSDSLGIWNAKPKMYMAHGSWQIFPWNQLSFGSFTIHPSSRHLNYVTITARIGTLLLIFWCSNNLKLYHCKFQLGHTKLIDWCFGNHCIGPKWITVNYATVKDLL